MPILVAFGLDPAGRGWKSNQNPGRNSKIVASTFGKATIYDFEVIL